jgi:hypothetical protein
MIIEFHKNYNNIYRNQLKLFLLNLILQLDKYAVLAITTKSAFGNGFNVP